MTASDPKPQTWTLLELLRWTTRYFAERGIETPRLDAECLLASALDVDRMYLGFQIPDEFVVGYGLDYNQQYRTLDGVYVWRE